MDTSLPIMTPYHEQFCNGAAAVSFRSTLWGTSDTETVSLWYHGRNACAVPDRCCTRTTFRCIYRTYRASRQCAIAGVAAEQMEFDTIYRKLYIAIDKLYCGWAHVRLNLIFGWTSCRSRRSWIASSSNALRWRVFANSASEWRSCYIHRT